MRESFEPLANLYDVGLAHVSSAQTSAEKGSRKLMMIVVLIAAPETPRSRYNGQRSA